MRLTGSGAYARSPRPTMPPGLTELMEDLSKNVLRHSPENIYEFCANHMAKLIEIRDGRPPRKALTLEQKIKSAQKILKKRVDERRKKYDEAMQAFLQQQKEELHETEENQTLTVKAPVLHDQILKDASEIEIFHSSVDKEVETVTQDPPYDNLENNTDNAESLEENVNKSELLVSISMLKEMQEKMEDNTAETCNTIKDAGEEIAKVSKNYEKYEQELKLPEDTNLSTSVLDIKPDEEFTETIKEIESMSTSALKEVDTAESMQNDYNKKLSDAAVGEINTDDLLKIAESHETLVDSIKKHSDTEVNDNAFEYEDSKEVLNKNLRDYESIEINKDTEIIEPQFKQQTSSNLDVCNESETEYKNTEYNNNTNIEDNIHFENEHQPKGISEVNTKKDISVEHKHQSGEIKHENILTNVNIAASSTLESNSTDCQTHNTKDILHRGPSPSDVHSAEKTLELTINENQIKENEGENESSNLKNHSIGLDTNTTSSSNLKESSRQENDVEQSKHYDDTSDTLDNVSNISEGLTFEGDSKGIETLVLGNIIASHDDSVDASMDGGFNNYKNPMDLETAAVTIQKVFRSFMFKSRCSTFEESVNEETNINSEDSDDVEKQNEFITTYNMERRPLGISRMDTVLQTVNEEKSLSLSTDDSSLSSAATVIQAHVRGFLVRNRLNSNKSSSIVNSSGKSTQSLESDTDAQKNKTVLNIHIVPEGEQLLGRDESLLTSVDLSLDGSPPSTVNLHPLGYDKNQPRKQLKREDAIQSLSPPSNNSGKLSEDSKDSLIDVTAEFIREEKTYCQLIENATRSLSPPIEQTNNSIKDVIAEFLREEIAYSQKMASVSVSPPNDQLKEENNVTHIIAVNDVTHDIESEKSLHQNEDDSQLSKNNNSCENISNNGIEALAQVDEAIQYILLSSNTGDNLAENFDTANDAVGDETSSLIDNKKHESQIRESFSKSDGENKISVTDENTGELPDSSKDVLQSDLRKRSVTKMSSDESDVVTASVKSTTSSELSTSKMMHSGEFHDAVLPTKITRTDTSVVRGE